MCVYLTHTLSHTHTHTLSLSHTHTHIVCNTTYVYGRQQILLDIKRDINDKSTETSKKRHQKRHQNRHQKRRQRRHQKRPIDIKCATDFSARQETHINQKRHQNKIKKNVEGDIKRDPHKLQESFFCARQEAHPRCRHSSRRRSRRAWLLSLSTATRRLNMRSLPRLLGRYADVCT